jgi:hypothetical protein
MKKKSRYRRKCSCGKYLADGVCPEGCDAYKKPALAVQRAQRGRKPESARYLSLAEVNVGLNNFLRNAKLRHAQ